MSRDALTLLRAATEYCTASVEAVTPQMLSRPTPCAGWDVRMLLAHADDALRALMEGFGTGGISPAGAGIPGASDPAREFRAHADQLHAVISGPISLRSAVVLADRTLPLTVAALIGAVEVTVHGWDLTQSCGIARPIPPALADELLRIASRTMTAAGRYPEFGPPVPISPSAPPGDRLVAFLGRRPLV